MRKLRCTAHPGVPAASFATHRPRLLHHTAAVTQRTLHTLSSSQVQPTDPTQPQHLLATAPTSHRQFFQQTFADLEANLLSPNRALFPADAFSYEAFVWAVATVRSRAHSPLDGANIAMVPLADQVRW